MPGPRAVAVRARAGRRGLAAARRATSSSAAATRAPASTTRTTTSRASAGAGARRATATTPRSSRTATARTRRSRSSRRATRGCTSATASTPTAAAPGAQRGGLGITRVMTVEADEIVVSALCRPLAHRAVGPVRRRRGRDHGVPAAPRGRPRTFAPFSEAVGHASATRSSPTCACERGDQVLLRSPSGGGYGPPLERDARARGGGRARGLRDRRARARERYGVVLTRRRRGRRRGDRTACAGRAPDALGRARRGLAPRRTSRYCEVTGQLLPKRYWAFEHEGRTIRARNPHCEELYRELRRCPATRPALTSRRRPRRSRSIRRGSSCWKGWARTTSRSISMPRPGRVGGRAPAALALHREALARRRPGATARRP